MFDNSNSDNGQRRLRFNFGKKFKRKPYNHKLSEQENMMNLINDYRQWQQDNPQPDCSNMSTREILEAVVSDFRAQQREEEREGGGQRGGGEHGLVREGAVDRAGGPPLGHPHSGADDHGRHGAVRGAEGEQDVERAVAGVRAQHRGGERAVLLRAAGRQARGDRHEGRQAGAGGPELGRHHAVAAGAQGQHLECGRASRREGHGVGRVGP